MPPCSSHPSSRKARRPLPLTPHLDVLRLCGYVYIGPCRYRGRGGLLGGRLRNWESHFGTIGQFGLNFQRKSQNTVTMVSSSDKTTITTVIMASLANRAVRSNVSSLIHPNSLSPFLGLATSILNSHPIRL